MIIKTEIGIIMCQHKMQLLALNTSAEQRYYDLENDSLNGADEPGLLTVKTRTNSPVIYNNINKYLSWRGLHLSYLLQLVNSWLI